MGIDIETLASWPFPEGIFEDPRPGMRPPGLEDMTGMYALRLVCERVIEAESAQAAHDLLAHELGETARTDQLGLVADDAVAAEASPECVVDEPCWDTPHVPPPAPPSALHFTPGVGQPRTRPALGLVVPVPDGEPAAERPLPGTGPDDPPARIEEGDGGRFRARYHAEVSCVRDVWARDEAHAEELLAEDVAVLLTEASLDRWVDDSVGLLFWRIESVTAEGEPA